MTSARPEGHPPDAHGADDHRPDVHGPHGPASRESAGTTVPARGPAVGTPSNGNPIILFDGVCNLCSASVRFVADRDRRQRFRFAFLQSETGQGLMRRHDLDDGDLLSSVILIDRGRAYEKSTAALRIAKQLDGLWPALFALILIPKPLRDWVYDFVGQRRYRWFGQTSVCQIPRDDLRERLLP